MAILDSLNLGFLSANYLTILGPIILAVAIFVIIEFAVRRSSAESGTRSERALERREGLGFFERAVRSIQEYRRRAKGEEKSYVSAEASMEARAKNIGMLEADEAVREGAQAAAHEESAEVAAEGVEGRSIGIEAAIKEIVRAMMEYASKMKVNILTQEQQAIVLEGILKKINDTANYNVIDERINEYLEQFLNILAAKFQENLESEETKNKLAGSLANKIKDAVKEMKSSTRRAKAQLRRVRRMEGKTRKDFIKEWKYLKDSLKAKVKELGKLNSIKDTDPRVASARISEINLLSRQMESAKTIRKQLQATYSFIKGEIRQMKKLLNYVLSNEKGIKSYEELLDYRKIEVDGNFKRLSAAVSSIEKIAQAKIKNPHETVSYLSGGLKNYFEVYSRILEQNLSFDSVVKSITIKSFVISQQMKAFQKLKKAFTQSKEGLKSGVEALTELTKSVVGEESKANVDGIVEKLQGARKILEYEQSIESFMESLAQTLQNKSRQVNADIQLIIDEEKKLIENIKEEEKINSSHLGSVIGTAVRRKIEIDEDYMAKAVAYGNELDKTNRIVANSYRQAMNAESLALAA